MRNFFERLRDRDSDEASAKTSIFPDDFADPTMKKFTLALPTDPYPRRRVGVEILAQTAPSGWASSPDSMTRP